MTRQVASNSRVSRSTRSVFGLQKAFLAIILVVIAMALFNLNPSTRTEFFTEVNFIDLAKSSSIFLILAMGETFVLIAGGVDLSIGGMMALSGVVVIMLINAGVPIPVAIALCLLLGLAVGAINAFISVYQRTEPFIITLGHGHRADRHRTAADERTSRHERRSGLPEHRESARSSVRCRSWSS